MIGIINNRRLPFISLVLVIGIAAWLRFYQLDSYPVGLIRDEIWLALDARDLREGVTACCPLYFGLPFGGHPLFVYLTVLSQMLGAPPAISGRIVSAVFSLASVITSFFAFRSLARSFSAENESSWIGVAGAATLAATVSLLTFSRFGLETMLAAVTAVPIFWLVWLAFERQSYRLALAAGFALGLSLYGYAPAAAFVLVPPIYAGWRWLAAPPTTRERIVKLTLALLATTALVVTPFVLTLIYSPNQYLSHLLGTTQATRSGGPIHIGVNLIVKAFLTLAGISLFTHASDEYNFHGEPLFNPIVSVFFWIGIAIAIDRARHKQSACQLALVWAVCASLPPLLSDQTPHLGRWLGALPALAFFVGLGVVNVWRAFESAAWFQDKRGRVVMGAALALVVSFTVYQTIAVYFEGTQRPLEMNGVPQRFSAEKAVELSRSATVFVSPTNDGLIQPVFDLLLRDTPVRQIDGRTCLPLAWDEAAPAVYGVVSITDKSTLDQLHSLYPSGHIVAEFLDFPNPYPYSQFFEVPPRAAPALSITSARTDFPSGIALMGYQLASPEAAPSGQLAITLYWRPETSPTDELIAFVHLGQPGVIQPAAQHDGPPCSADSPTSRWAPNFVYADRHSIQLPPSLPPGVYEVRAGLYRWPDLVRQTIIRTEQSSVIENIVVLTTITVH